MSHFSVLVTKTNKVSVEEQLEPYDENIEVEPYDRECYCIGNIARSDARKKAEEQLGWSIDNKHDEYWKLPEEQRTDEKWKESIKPFVELEDRLEKEHLLFRKPNPNCDECNGNGTRKSTYNPKSKWDWYVIGGRWLGYFELKEGTHGQLGESGAFDNKPEHDADITKVKDIEKIEPTFAVIHNGEWYEQGEMGWWGMVNNERSKEDWKTEFNKIIQGLDPEDEVALVDCHI